MDAVPVSHAAAADDDNDTALPAARIAPHLSRLCDANQQTALHRAAFQGDVEKVKTLLASPSVKLFIFLFFYFF